MTINIFVRTDDLGAGGQINQIYVLWVLRDLATTTQPSNNNGRKISSWLFGMKVKSFCLNYWI